MSNKSGLSPKLPLKLQEDSLAGGLDVSSTSGSKNNDLPAPMPPTPPRRRKAKRSDLKMQVNRRAEEDVGECTSSSDGEGGTLYSNQGHVIPETCVKVKKEVDCS
eukprot:10636059-Ditylum_brightwellii.AAC.1